MEARNEETSSAHRSGIMMETKLLRIAGKARRDKKCRFTSLFHLMNRENLRECFESLSKTAAPGIDKMTERQYANDLWDRLSRLTELLAQYVVYSPIRKEGVYP